MSEVKRDAQECESCGNGLEECLDCGVIYCEFCDDGCDCDLEEDDDE